ncbi:MAG TPA: hypothetical protein VFO31_30150 [Vicinamibacterales bacterium]|nr:hypothetical protein [Vicinamibacterales bacterium]
MSPPIGRREQDMHLGPIGSIVRSILHTSGPMALIAIGLTFFLTWAIWGRLDEIERNQHTIIDAMTNANVRMSAFVAEHTQIERQRERLLYEQIALLRNICRSVAETDNQAVECTKGVPYGGP